MLSLCDLLQCVTLDPLLQPSVNNIPLNISHHDNLRINPCFEQGVLQPTMGLIILIIAISLLCGRSSSPAATDDVQVVGSPTSADTEIAIGGGKTVKRSELFLSRHPGNDAAVSTQCYSRMIPVLLASLATSISIAIYVGDSETLPKPHGLNVSKFYGNASFDGTNGTMSVFVGDGSEILSSLCMTIVTIGVAKSGKTPVIATVWAIIMSLILGLEARLSVKRLLLLYLDPSSSISRDIREGIVFESVIQLDKEPIFLSWLRLIRVFVYIFLTFILLLRRDFPRSDFDPRNHMPESYYEQHPNKRPRRLQSGHNVKGIADAEDSVPTSPLSPSDDDDQGLHFSKRHSNEYGASLCSRLAFGFVTPLLMAGGRAALEMKQLFLLGGEDDAVLNARRLQVAFDRVKRRGKKNALIKAVLSLYVKEIVVSGILMLAGIVCTLLQPLVLNQLLTFIQQTEVENSLPNWTGYLFACLGAVCIFLQQLFQTQAYWLLTRMGYRVRGAVTVLLFEKSLRLSQPEMSSIGIGKIVNLAEVDAMKLMWSMYVVHQVWSLPLTLLVGLIQLYFFISWASLAGIGVMVLLTLPNIFFMKKAIQLLRFVFSLRDARVKLLAEHIGGIRLIKMLGWEHEKVAEIGVKRKEENDNRYWMRFWFGNVGMVATSTPALINIATFCIYMALLGPTGQLTAATGFTILSLTGIIQGPVSGLGRILQIFATINISLKRIERFLKSDEMPLVITNHGQLITNTNDAYKLRKQKSKAEEQADANKTVDSSPTIDKSAGDVEGYFWDMTPLNNAVSAACEESTNTPGNDRGSMVSHDCIVLKMTNASFKWAALKEKDQKLLDEGRKGAAKRGRGRGRGRGRQGRGRGSGKKRVGCCGSKPSKNDDSLDKPLLDPVAQSSDVSNNDKSKDANKENQNASDLEEGGFGKENIDGAGKAGAEEEAQMGPTIQDINMCVRQGQLAMIVGKVGSGKTTLLTAMLNEVPFESGRVDVRGTRAYCSQVAWIQNLTVRENILMGEPFDQQRYDQAVHASCLATDLEQLPAGDSTEIGERGISLSGGQKKRIAFARAVYSQADGYYLDDILSAVDAHVADHIMKEGICSALAGRTRILVTHAIHLLEYADIIFVMDKGKIVEQGSFNELKQRFTSLTKYIDMNEATTGRQKEDVNENEDEENDNLSSESDDAKKKTKEENEGDQKPTKSKEEQKAGKKLIGKEERVYGGVRFAVWVRFFQNLGLEWSFLMLLAVIIGVSVDQLLSWWLTYWTDAADVTNSTNTSSFVATSNIPGEAHTQVFYLSIFSVLNVVSVLMIGMKIFLRMPAGYQLSERIHRDALWGVFRAPMTYFDTTKSGRIINKFSSDLSTVDASLMNNVLQFVTSIVNALLCTIMVLLICPVILLVMLPVLVVFYFVQRTYRASIRELQRLCSASRSPVFSALNEALDGAATVRCFNKQAYFALLNENRLRTNLSCYMNQNATSRWLSVRLVTLSSVVFFSVAVFSVLQKKLGLNISVISTGEVFTSGMAGLALQKTLEVTSIMEGFINSLASAETALISMERLLGFAKLDAEAPLLVADDEQRSPTSASVDSRGTPRRDAMAHAQTLAQDTKFPVNGEVEFRDVTMAYRKGLPNVLNGVSFRVPSGNSVGIVGRTGAGKSSLIMALYRLVRIDEQREKLIIQTCERKEAIAPVLETNSGAIYVGGVDIAKVGLHRLRRGLSIIPQEPELFSGNIRSNMDPWNEFTDDEIWKTLEACEMKKFFKTESGDKGLNFEVATGGSNLSVGQRQLLCLARAILRRAKVLVMDEATGSVDTLTDTIIQRTLSKQAKETGCTVLTIAHRIKTIINNDLIIVMEYGKVAEMGSPTELLKNDNSIFSSLAKKQGLLS
jgi:ABC-type multidrug transport system fused ATPase/permease subunit